MADYYTLIARAAANAGSEASRKLMYDRARTAQLTHLRKLEPPLTESEVVHWCSLLEEAIRRVEREAAGDLPEVEVNGALVNRQVSCPTPTAEVKRAHEPGGSRNNRT